MMFQVNTFQIPDISALITNVIGVIIRKIPTGDFTQKINRTSLVVDHVWSCVIKMRDVQVWSVGRICICRITQLSSPIVHGGPITHVEDQRNLP